MLTIVALLRGIRNSLAAVFLVSNLMALFLVVALTALVWYTVVASPGMTTAIIGFSSGIIGTITGFYFNKDQLSAAQREQSAQGALTSGYSETIQELRENTAELTRRNDNMVRLIQRMRDEGYSG